MRTKFTFCIALLAVTLAGTAALAEPAKKKPNYPPPEQSSSVGVLGQPHHDANASSKPHEPSAPLAAPEIPKVEAEPPTPSAAPENYVVHPEDGDTGTADAGGAPMMRAPMGPPPSGFLPDHPFISGIVAGLVGTDLGSKLYGGQMMGDQDGVMIGYGVRFGLILLVAWLVFRMISRRASGLDEPGLAPPGRREPTFGRGPDVGAVRREPTFSRRDHH